MDKNQNEHHELAKAVADFWVAQLSPVPGSDAGFDKGDKSQLMAIMLHQLAAMSIDETDKLNFAMHVYDVVVAELKRGYNSFTLRVDYHPEGLLREALDMCPNAKAIESQLPWKTTLSIRDGVVSAACGYGGQWQQIYPQVAT